MENMMILYRHDSNSWPLRLKEGKSFDNVETMRRATPSLNVPQIGRPSNKQRYAAEL